MNGFSVFFWLGILLLADSAIGLFWLDRFQQRAPFRLKPVILAEVVVGLLLILPGLLFE